MSNPRYPSAKMIQAQAYFQTVVKHELQALLAHEMDREVAVKQLLHRIVASTEAPDAMEVKRVMKQFQMQYEDAERALIVKQEIGRLKRQGFDAFAAIEELTRKMQQRTDDHDQGVEGKRENGNESVQSQEEEEEGSSTSTSPGGLEEEEDEEEEEEEKEVENETTRVSSPLHLSSLSLCQRIDQVTISSVLPTVYSTGMDEQKEEEERVCPPPPPPSPSLSPSSPVPNETTTSCSLVSVHSKKRRASTCPTQSTTQPIVPVVRRKGSRVPRHHVNMVHKPRSPTLEVPTVNKKQKIWTSPSRNEELMARKAFFFVDPPSSPTAISSTDPTAMVEVEKDMEGSREEAVSTVHHHRTQKRSLPVLPIEEDPVVRLHGTKRHKPSS